MNDLDRILQMPKVEVPHDIMDPLADAMRIVEGVRRAGSDACLLDDQVRFLGMCAYARDLPETAQGRRGVLGFMSCGSGKTLALQLAPLVFRARRAVLVTEANLVPQLNDDIATWGRHFELPVSRVVTYGKLSHPTGKGLLETIRPDLVLCDEGHKIGRGARSKRLWEYLEEHRDCRVVIVSGSLMSKSIYDLADAASMTLREYCPLPFHRDVLDHWASVLDAGGEYGEMDIGAVKRLVEWNNTVPRRADIRPQARAAFSRRLSTTPGVVVTSGPLDVGVSLQLSMTPPLQSDELVTLQTKWELPDGTQLVDMLEYHRHATTLRIGFWYRFDPDTVDEQWMERRRHWNGVLRGYLEDGLYDSPYYVVQAAERSELSPSAMVAYHRWTDIRSRVAPPTRETMWISDGRERVLALARAGGDEGDGRAIWYHSRALEGLSWWPRLVDASTPPPRATSAPIVISLAHRQGWNGQAYNQALVLEPPSSAREMEQLLARHHRRGQTSDVRVALVGTDADRAVMMSRAKAVMEITNTPQRFILADWV